MKKFLAASLLPLGTIGAVLAFAAPAHADSASSTINSLRAQGYDVKVSRVGNAPLEECSVIEVRNLPGAQLPLHSQRRRRLQRLHRRAQAEGGRVAELLELTSPST